MQGNSNFNSDCHSPRAMYIFHRNSTKNTMSSTTVEKTLTIFKQTKLIQTSALPGRYRKYYPTKIPEL